MKNLKRNQVIIFVIAIMLVTAGYLNYTTNTENSNSAISTSATTNEVNDIQELGALGDAKLVNANLEENSEIGEAVIEEGNNKQDGLSNSSYESNTIDVKQTSSKTTDEYFTSSKLTRENMYSQMLESYEKILENPNISPDQKQISENEIKNINDNRNKIMICENLLKTKGINESVIFINGDSVNVVVRIDKLEQEQIAQIQNIISREMGSDINNIHISNK